MAAGQAAPAHGLHRQRSDRQDVGGNLTVLALDIAWIGRPGDRFAAAHAEETAPSVAMT
jgi:hypothetical protein